MENSDNKFLWKLLGGIFLLALLITVMGFVFGWISLPFLKGSADNVEKQFTKGYELYASLQTTARTVCEREKLKQENDTFLNGYISNYNSLQGQYDAWARNVFQGKVIKPSDLPSEAPTLSVMKDRVCK